MKMFMAGAAVSGLILASVALPAFAAPISPGPSTITVIKGPQDPGGDSFNLDGRGGSTKLPASGSMFTDYYTFSVSAMMDLDASFTTSGKTVAPTGVTLSLYSGLVGSGLFIQSTTTSGEAGAIDYTLMSGSSYYLQISGTSKNPVGNYGGTATFLPSAVPLPSSVALFGAAVAGLGVFGASKRKKASASAA